MALIIYGAYGYTGQLVVEEALRRGLQPVLAGRHAEKLRALAEPLGLPAHPFALDVPGNVDAGIEGARLVLNCAGPFSRTAVPLAAACLRQQVHYTDVTGEIPVFERLAAMNDAARKAGVMLLPGAGFDVVPSDCLAQHLKEQLPDASTLRLGFYSKGGPSHGTALTVVENLGLGGAVRKGGLLTRVPAAWKRRVLTFGEKRYDAMTIPWGDVSTAWYSTGIPDIEVYMAAPPGVRRFLRLSRYFKGLLASAPVQRFLQRRIPEGGPTPEQRASNYCLLWGEARNDAGNTVEARLRTPDGYTLTAAAAVEIAVRVLEGNAPPGFQTPARAYGSELVMALPGVQRL